METRGVVLIQTFLGTSAKTLDVSASLFNYGMSVNLGVGRRADHCGTFVKRVVKTV